MAEHFIITRFNLLKTDWKRDRSQVPVLDEKWLEDRIKLFLDFCLPSVVNQSSGNFKWLIFFEKDSKSKLAGLPEHLKTWSFIESVFVEGYKEFQDGLAEIIHKRMKQVPGKLITTRLDNDDALHKDFVKDTQEMLATAEPDTVLHFPYGFCLQQGKKNKLALQHYPLNQFLSLLEIVEETKGAKTVYASEHDKWDEAQRVLSGGDKPRWLQVVHERNMANTFKGIPVFKKHLENFPINKQEFSWDYDLRLGIKKLAAKTGILRC